MEIIFLLHDEIWFFQTIMLISSLLLVNVSSMHSNQMSLFSFTYNGFSAKTPIYHPVVLGWIISLCVEPGIEPATFRFQSKVLVTPLPSLRSSSTFLLLSLSLLLSFFLSLSLSLCFFLRFSSTFFPASRQEKVAEKKNESVFIYATLPIVHFLSL